MGFMFQMRIHDNHAGPLPDVPAHARGACEVRITVRIVRETPKAYLIERAANPQGQTWVPISKVFRVNQNTFTVDLLMDDWLYSRIREQI